MRADSGGDFWNILIGGAVGAVAGFAISLISQLADDESDSISPKQFWAHVGVSTAVGALSGGLAASGVGIAGQVIGNSIFSAIGSVADTAIDGETSFGTYVLRASEGATIGAISGLIGNKGSASKHVSNHFWRMVGSRANNLPYYFTQINKQAVRDGLKAIPSILKSNIPSVTKIILKSIG